MTDRMQQVLDNLRRQIGDSQWDGFVEACYDAFGKCDQLDGENAVLFEQVQNLKRENGELRIVDDALEKANNAMRERLSSLTDEEQGGWPLKDMDGKDVHVGDMLAGYNTFTLEPCEPFQVGRIVFDDSCVGVCVYDTDDVVRDVAYAHHVEPDTWERIIEDATALGAQMGRRTTQVDDLVARCKALCERAKEGDAE